MVDYFITLVFLSDTPGAVHMINFLLCQLMQVHPETMEKISFKSKLYSSVFWNSKQLGMLHYNEESNILMKYSRKE
jgi:hypothetical protein